jgi:hypothetical protein
MYINLILGLIVVGAILWLVRSYRKSRASPGAILLDEISKRRVALDKKKDMQERLKNLRHKHLKLLSEGLANMREALDNPLPMRWQEQEERLELTLEPTAGEEKFILRWDIKNLDWAFLAAYERSPEFYGEYILQWPDGSVIAEAELASFLRELSAIIADKLT